MNSSGATLFQALSHLCSPVQREDPVQLAGAGEVNPIHIHMEELFKAGTQLGRAAWGSWCFSKDSSACPNVFFSSQGVSNPQWKPLYPSCLCGEKDSWLSCWAVSPACAGCCRCWARAGLWAEATLLLLEPSPGCSCPAWGTRGLAASISPTTPAREQCRPETAQSPPESSWWCGGSGGEVGSHCAGQGQDWVSAGEPGLGTAPWLWGRSVEMRQVWGQGGVPVHRWGFAGSVNRQGQLCSWRSWAESKQGPGPWAAVVGKAHSSWPGPLYPWG